MKIPQTVLASLLGKMGRKVKAELVIDDSNGTSLTFPEISDVSEIAEGVAISAPDGTYVIADGDNAITIVVAGGVVTSVTVDSPVAAEVDDSQVVELLEAVVDSNVEATQKVTALEGQVTALKSEIAELKTLLKHDDGKPAAGAAAGGTKTKWKTV